MRRKQICRRLLLLRLSLLQISRCAVYITNTQCENAAFESDSYCLQHIQYFHAINAATDADYATEAAEIATEDAAAAEAEADGIEYNVELLCSVYDEVTKKSCENVVGNFDEICPYHTQQVLDASTRDCMVSGCANERYKEKLYCTHHIELFEAEDDAAYGPDF